MTGVQTCALPIYVWTEDEKLHATTSAGTALVDWVRAVIEGPLPETVRP